MCISCHTNQTNMIKSKKRKIPKQKDFYFPNEIWISILQFLKLADCSIFFLVSKQLYSVKNIVIQEKWKCIPVNYKIKFIGSYETKTLYALKEFEYPISKNSRKCTRCFRPYEFEDLKVCRCCNVRICNRCNNGYIGNHGFMNIFSTCKNCIKLRKRCPWDCF